jgi:D-glycero-alpha-D-manno-heptose 1-phosphate guanylyltransferase|tara:strand:- start:1646 stop:2356 length:711 start_codon:yes stop_codon:yes gene_type:complete
MIKKNRIDALILCGGFGTRLKKISKGIPKALIRIKKDKVFLDFLINKLLKLDCLSKIYLCVHYKKENFKRYVKDKKLHNKVFISYEKIPLGTSGAIKNLVLNKKNTSENFLIINGDSYSKIDLKKFIFTFYNKKKNLIALSKVKNSKRYGSFKLNGEKIHSIIKDNSKPGWINNGYYLLSKKDAKSLEYYRNLEDELFLKMNKKNNLLAFKVKKDNFIDIGTILDYKKFKKNVKKI